MSSTRFTHWLQPLAALFDLLRSRPSLRSHGRRKIAVLFAGAAASIGVTPIPVSAAAAVTDCYFGSVTGDARTDYAISWTPVAAVDAEAPGARGGYVISRQVGGTGTWWWRNRAEPGTSTWFDNNAGAAGTTPSQYRIKTKDADGNFSADVVCQPLGSVENVRLEAIERGAGSSDITIGWDPVPGATGYKVLRSEGDDEATTVAADMTGTSWTDNAVANGHYAWSVVALVTAMDDSATTHTWESAPSSTTATAQVTADAVSDEQYATKKVDGRWELIDAADVGRSDPTVQRWQSIGVRYDNTGGLDAIDETVLGDIDRQGFNAIRLPLHWSDVETSKGVYDQRLLTDVDELIARADTAGLGVILDPIHLGGGAAEKFWIPPWAWDKAWTGSRAAATDPDDSTEVLMWDDPTDPDDDDLALDYLGFMLDRYKDEPAVVAIELVNEPHPTAGNAWGNTSDIAELQAKWVDELRQIDADKPLIVTGFFGGFLADGSKFADAFTTDGRPNWDNIVFTAHSYYSGIAVPGDIDADDDGYGDVDDPATYKRGSKTGTRVEGYSSRGCYGVAGHVGGSASSPYTCTTPDFETRATAVANLAAGFTAQDDVAQGADMPLFVGEFGTHPYRYVETGSYTGWAGWGNADLMLCDQIKALRQVHGTHEVSYSVWDLTTGGFGTYDLATTSWNDLGEQFADSSCTGRPSDR